MVGYAMTAIGALVAGHALTWAQAAYGITAVQGYRFIFLQYAASGAVLLLMFLLLTNKVWAVNGCWKRLGVKRVVRRAMPVKSQNTHP